MALIRLITSDDSVIYVNPEKIQYLCQYNKTTSTIVFGDSDFLKVKGLVDDVYEILNSVPKSPKNN